EEGGVGVIVHGLSTLRNPLQKLLLECSVFVFEVGIKCREI
ncbi:MAG: hypothetical protein RLZZ296_1633, partial [Pseudomonadota bacterium]